MPILPIRQPLRWIPSGPSRWIRQLATECEDVEKHTRYDPAAGSSAGAVSASAPAPIHLSPPPSTVEYDSGPEHHNIGTDDEDSDDMADPYGFVDDCGSVTKADAEELNTFMSECR
ncbi:hypothetical protein N9L68_06485 [bacterium]|nr:hypothetical protein [bacterium]